MVLLYSESIKVNQMRATGARTVCQVIKCKTHNANLLDQAVERENIMMNSLE